MGPDGKELGEIATDVLFENDRVKIWNLTVEPGESSDWHHHVLDYITVGLTNSEMRREMEDGTGDLTNPDVGEVRYAAAHQPHVVTNIGTNPHRNILIELK